MGTRSSKYTKYHPKLSRDCRVLNEETLSAVMSLVRLAGSGSGKGHPSNHRQRRAALKALRLHTKVAIGYHAPGRMKPTPPKYPHRMTGHTTSGELFTQDNRFRR